MSWRIGATPVFRFDGRERNVYSDYPFAWSMKTQSIKLAFQLRISVAKIVLFVQSFSGRRKSPY